MRENCMLLRYNEHEDNSTNEGLFVCDFWTKY